MTFSVTSFFVEDIGIRFLKWYLIRVVYKLVGHLSTCSEVFLTFMEVTYWLIIFRFQRYITFCSQPDTTLTHERSAPTVGTTNGNGRDKTDTCDDDVEIVEPQPSNVASTSSMSKNDVGSKSSEASSVIYKKVAVVFVFSSFHYCDSSALSASTKETNLRPTWCTSVWAYCSPLTEFRNVWFHSLSSNFNLLSKIKWLWICCCKRFIWFPFFPVSFLGSEWHKLQLERKMAERVKFRQRIEFFSS